MEYAEFLPNSYGGQEEKQVTLLLGGGLYHALYLEGEEQERFLFEEVGDAAKLQRCRVVERTQILLERAISKRSSCALAAAAYQMGLVEERVCIVGPYECAWIMLNDKRTVESCSHTSFAPTAKLEVHNVKQ